MQSDKISSQAVTKYGAASIAPYIELEKHTDLNLPPSNWLKDNLAGRFSEQNKRKNNPFDCSSLLMANRYPEIIGEVDVVSSADHIKKLLKMPFSNGDLSMTVHRIGKSLLLNELDIPALLQYDQENPNLQWLRDLYCSATNTPTNSQFCRKKRNKEQIQNSQIQSKFMYHSIEDIKVPHDEQPPLLIQSESSDNQSDASTSVLDLNNPVTSLLSVNATAGINSGGNLENDSYFLRDVLWTFEDITMMVGSNLPIFGGGKYPAVSLRLRDSSKPISILTGIDYWLDNLMCNVPELIMCYHLKGIVQKYEQIKTTELPHMEESGFSPKVIKDVAQNILSFLKSNCAKEGHTYWLYKSNNDEVVKLYDLTSICAESSATGSHNPFSMSVAILLYQIVRNMFTSGEINNKNIGKARTLLQHCAKLLEQENRPEILFLTNYLLSELYTTNVFNDPADSSEIYEEEYDKSDDELSDSEKSFESNVTSVSVKALSVPSSGKIKSIKNSECVMEFIDEESKCKKTLSFVIDALKCLDYLHAKMQLPDEGGISVDQAEIKRNKDELQMLPLEDHSVQQTINNTLSHDLKLLKITKKDTDDAGAPSFSNLKDTLLRKATQCYITLTNINITREKFGRALRFLQIASYCLSNMIEPEHCSSASVSLLVLSGDILTMIVNEKGINKESEMEDFQSRNKYDIRIYDILDVTKELSIEGFNVNILEENLTKGKEDLLISAVKLYECGLLLTTNDRHDEDISQVIEVTRKLGNVRNELGVYYMNEAASMAKQYGAPSDHELQLWKKSFGFFERSIQSFEVVNDRINKALLYSNMGRLMRLCAQVYGFSTRQSLGEQRGQYTQQEKTYFHKSFEYYHKALSVLQSKENDIVIWMKVSNELSAAYFMMSNVMQDYAPLNTIAEEKVVKEVSSSLMKVLQYAEPILNDCVGNEKNVITLRIAMVHQRLASLYHHVLRNQISDHGKKNYRSLAELHYRKVYGILKPTWYPIEILRVFVLHAALFDYILVQGYSGKNLKAKLELFLSSNAADCLLSALNKMVNVQTSNNNTKKQCEDEILGEDDHGGELEKIIHLLQVQINSTLKEIIKFLTNRKHKVIDTIDLTLAKRMYEVVLRGLSTSETNIVKNTKLIVQVITTLKSIYNGL